MDAVKGADPVAYVCDPLKPPLVHHFDDAANRASDCCAYSPVALLRSVDWKDVTCPECLKLRPGEPVVHIVVDGQFPSCEGTMCGKSTWHGGLWLWEQQYVEEKQEGKSRNHCPECLAKLAEKNEPKPAEESAVIHLANSNDCEAKCGAPLDYTIPVTFDPKVANCEECLKLNRLVIHSGYHSGGFGLCGAKINGISSCWTGIQAAVDCPECLKLLQKKEAKAEAPVMVEEQYNGSHEYVTYCVKANSCFDATAPWQKQRGSLPSTKYPHLFLDAITNVKKTAAGFYDVTLRFSPKKEPVEPTKEAPTFKPVELKAEPPVFLGGSNVANFANVAWHLPTSSSATPSQPAGMPFDPADPFTLVYEYVPKSEPAPVAKQEVSTMKTLRSWLLNAALFLMTAVWVVDLYGKYEGKLATYAATAQGWMQDQYASARETVEAYDYADEGQQRNTWISIVASWYAAALVAVRRWGGAFHFFNPKVGEHLTEPRSLGNVFFTWILSPVVGTVIAGIGAFLGSKKSLRAFAIHVLGGEAKS